MKRLTLIVLLTLLACLPCWGQTVYNPLWYWSGTGLYTKPNADSTTSVQILKADGTTQVIGVDTTNSRAIVGTGTSTADFAVKPDTDATVYLGRVVVGTISGGVSDYAYFGHIDSSATGYAIRQAPTGDTSFNCITGQSLFFRQNGSAHSGFDSSRNFGVGTVAPWSRLSVDGGDGSFRNTATLGSGALSETAFTTHANWDVTGSCVDSGGNAAFTGAGTLTQTAGNMVGAVSLLPDCMYQLTYTVSNAATADGAATLTTGVAASAQTLSVAANGTAKTITFRSAASPGSFVINCTAGTFTLDDISCKPVQGGSVEAFGSVKTNSLTNFGGTSNIVIKPAGTGITVIGDAGSTARGLNTNDDLVVTGRAEIQGAMFVRQVTAATNMNTNVAGTAGEIAYCTSDSKAYVCTTTGAAGAAVWAALN